MRCFSCEKKEISLADKKIFCFFSIYTFVLLFFCSGSSPFIDYMPTDSSVFFAIGRSMAGGKVVYADVFDHKGWYLYVINYLGALISSSTSLGILLVEYVFFIANAVLLYHIASCFLPDIVRRIVFVMLMLALLLNYFTYSCGNLTETYAITFQLLSIVLLLDYSRTENVEHPPFYMLIHGLCVGIVFGLRANMIMMWGAIAIVIVFRLLYNKRNYNALMNILCGLCGLVLAFIPPVLYGLVTGSLDDMIYQSITFNLGYSDVSFADKILRTFYSPCSKVFLISGIISALIVFFSRLKLWEKIMFLSMLLLSYYSVTVSGRGYYHYFTYLIPFMIPVVIKLLMMVKDKWLKFSNAGFSFIVSIFFVLTLCLNMRTPIRMLFKPDSFYYMQAVNDISDIYGLLPSKDGRKVLVTHNNAVLYNKMNVIPNIQYFYLPSIPYSQYPYAVDCQVSSVLSDENDVVVLFYDDYDNKIAFKDIENNGELLSFLEQNYDLAYNNKSQAVQMWIKNSAS